MNIAVLLVIFHNLNWMGAGISVKTTKAPGLKSLLYAGDLYDADGKPRPDSNWIKADDLYDNLTVIDETGRYLFFASYRLDLKTGALQPISLIESGLIEGDPPHLNPHGVVKMHLATVIPHKGPFTKADHNYFYSSNGSDVWMSHITDARTGPFAIGTCAVRLKEGAIGAPLTPTVLDKTYRFFRACDTSGSFVASLDNRTIEYRQGIGKPPVKLSREGVPFDCYRTFSSKPILRAFVVLKRDKKLVAKGERLLAPDNGSVRINETVDVPFVQTWEKGKPSLTSLPPFPGQGDGAWVKDIRLLPENRMLASIGRTIYTTQPGAKWHEESWLAVLSIARSKWTVLGRGQVVASSSSGRFLLISDEWPSKESLSNATLYQVKPTR